MVEETEKLSACCGARLIGGIQCEACGADGREFEKAEAIDRQAEEREDERFDYHPLQGEEN